MAINLSFFSLSDIYPFLKILEGKMDCYENKTKEKIMGKKKNG